MKIHVLTLFPQTIESFFQESIVKRAIDKKILNLKIINIRNYAKDAHKTVDDKPYGGGKGMVLKVDVLHKALTSIKPKPYTILLSASGHKYNQKTAEILSSKKDLAIICGHYEGVDVRIEHYVDDIISIGDFVLTGGEIAAALIIDSITRLLPGAISMGSTKNESFTGSGKYLEYPQYTRPEIYKGQKVPKILVGGNHKEIENWRQQQSTKRIKKFRPDLLTSKME